MAARLASGEPLVSGGRCAVRCSSKRCSSSKHAQREGLIDKDVDPALYIVTWLDAVTFYFAYAHTMTDMIGKKPLSPEAVQHRRQQLMALQEKLFEK
jgi:hypothetical protein